MSSIKVVLNILDSMLLQQEIRDRFQLHAESLFENKSSSRCS